MRIFQILHSYKPYLPHFEKKYGINNGTNYEEHHKLLIKDRFYNSHLIKPCIDLNDTSGFYTMWDYPALQHKWAKEKGWNETDLKKILYAQIEEFKPDVFYNCSPISFEKDEIKENISENIIRICWFASPEKNVIDFSTYHSRLTNYPVDAFYTKVKNGFRSDIFHPAHDPVMNDYAMKEDRPIDIFFYGQYSDAFFKNRNELIDNLLNLKLKSKFNIEISLQYKIRNKNIYPFQNPALIRKVFSRIKLKSLQYPNSKTIENSNNPIYGIDLYDKISNSKIVFNASVDFSGIYKVNMRNFEALGCGAHLLSDEGIYPEGFEDMKHYTSYKNCEDIVSKAEYYLTHKKESREIAKNGYNMIKNKYSKENQWKRFQEIVDSI